MITLSTELLRIKGLSPNFLSKLKKLNITTVKGILWHFPFRYDDFTSVRGIGELQVNQTATVKGVVRKLERRRTWKKKMIVVEAVVSDESGGIKAVWFNQPYLANILKVGREVSLAGKVAYGDGEIYFSNPEYEFVGSGREMRHTAGLIPIYPETKGLTSRGIRYLVKPLLTVLPTLEDPLPQEVLTKNNLPEINFALKKIHFPESREEAEAARKRFQFEDLFLLQLNNLKIKLKLASERAPVLKCSKTELEQILKILPFELTASQKRSLDEILRDVAQAKPMNRLLQGDVGSGKTVVVAVAALVAAKAGKQAAFMAPTEVLARQHYHTFTNLFKDELSRSKIGINLILGSISEKSKKEIRERIAKNQDKILIGTHALIQDDVKFKNPGLVIIDEQHRFGVQQRAVLAAGLKGELPHFLSMSATPIPRTLSLTLFGDLDISIIDELPQGRKKIITRVVDSAKREKAYAFVREEISKGRQAFVICPRIEVGSEKLEVRNERSSVLTSNLKLPTSNRWSDVKTVTEEHEKLSTKIFPDLKVQMLHGKMKSSEKEKIMSGFKAGESDILVSTSVIEVGVDVPNASIMIIEGAELFGLSQLYQFRGRIGRGEHQSYCLMFTENSGSSVKERLNALLTAKNGFELAEMDLKFRGPGEFLGEKQTGFPDMLMRSLDNMELVRASRESANEILEQDSELSSFPLLKEKLESFKREVHLE